MDITQLQDIASCAICYDIYIKPTIIIPCGHTFCNKCIMTHIDNDMTCPLDKLEINPELFVVNYALENMLTILNIQCRYEGCNEIMQYEDMIEHMEVCNYRLIKCEYGCGEFIIATKLDTHLNECSHKPRLCNICNLIQPYNHHLSDCKECLVSCVYCFREMKLKNINNHSYECDCIHVICDICNHIIPKCLFHTHYIKHLNGDIFKDIFNHNAIIHISKEVNTMQIIDMEFIDDDLTGKKLSIECKYITNELASLNIKFPLLDQIELNMVSLYYDTKYRTIRVSNITNHEPFVISSGYPINIPFQDTSYIIFISINVHL